MADMTKHHLNDHGTSYRDGVASGIVPVPRLPTAVIVPKGSPSFVGTTIGKPRRYMENKLCSHCGTTNSPHWRFKSADSSIVLCRACHGYILCTPDGTLPPASFLAKRKPYVPRAAGPTRPRIWRKAERVKINEFKDTIHLCQRQLSCRRPHRERAEHLGPVKVCLHPLSNVPPAAKPAVSLLRRLPQ